MGKQLVVMSSENEFGAIMGHLAAKGMEKKDILLLCADFWPEKVPDEKGIETVFPEDFLSDSELLQINDKAGYFSEKWYSFDPEFGKEITMEGINLGMLFEHDAFPFFQSALIFLKAVSKIITTEKPESIIANKNSLIGKCAGIAAESKKFGKIELLDLHEMQKPKFQNFNKKKFSEIREKFPKILKRAFKKRLSQKKPVVFIKDRGYLGNLIGELRKGNELEVISLDEFLLEKIINPINAVKQMSKIQKMKKKFRHSLDKYLGNPLLIKEIAFEGMNFYDLSRPRLALAADVAWPEFAVAIEYLTGLFVKAKPKVVVLWEDYVAFERICALLARKYGATSIVVQHGEFGAPRKKGSWLRGFAPLSADKIAVFGKIEKQILINYGVEPERIIVTGAPRFDALRKRKFSAEKFRETLGIKSGEKLVVLATQVCFNKKDLMSIIGEIQKKREIRLVIKIHPTEDIGEYKKNAGEKAIVLQNTDLHGLLNAADAVILQGSTVGLEAMLLGKPVIIFGRSALDSIFRMTNAVLKARNKKGLTEALDTALDRKKSEKLRKKIGRFVYDATFRQDGKATERVARLVKESALKKNILGVIPARGGSKRLKDKNIVALEGRPLIAHTIEEALKARLLSEVIVSTDSKKIAEISEKYRGAKVPFLRPEELARDESPMKDTLQHAVRQFESLGGKKVDYVVVLQPTSPLRKASHIDSAIKKFLDSGANSLFSVTKPKKGSKFLVYLKNSRLHFADKSPEKGKKLFNLNGAIYVFDMETLFSGEPYPVGKKSVFFEMPLECSVDIDDKAGFAEAKKIIKKAKN